MSLASDYGVRVIRERFGPVLPDGLDYEDAETVAADQIACWMHWVEAEGGDPYEAWRKADVHFDAERGAGDDLANDPFYEGKVP